MVLTRVEGKTVSAAGTWPADVRSGCSEGYSTSRTCEMSLSKQTETHFKSLFYLLDKVPPQRSPGACHSFSRRSSWFPHHPRTPIRYVPRRPGRQRLSDWQSVGL
jgi:hypothetical protein